MSPGVIVAIAVAGVAVLLSCVLCIVLLERRRRAEKWKRYKESQEKAMLKKKFAKKTPRKVINAALRKFLEITRFQTSFCNGSVFQKKKKHKKTRKGKKSGDKTSTEGGKLPTSGEQGTQDEGPSEKSGPDSKASTEKVPEGSVDKVSRGSADRVSSADRIHKSKEESKEIKKGGDDGTPMNVNQLMQAIKENKIVLATAEDETDRKPRPKRMKF
ncbi:hypothetical protein Y032_0087g2012 [Ancylostoma ceylanicum]|uniref:Uncharacterized protein n=1 Tax=Ancylostoma ceylanicum TaxID=53326 RepID=A0A016TN78_9BILA|nr:hypothetical protein Y032_0087g2012 [Ancylostoma ceylanicum]